ncbi:hypothetical protein HPB48_017741 [Haemaphysalis longicornis]|uniref:Uncharacterized protein n=1 Tax=Haemaphysalis longicornis TaxID=44386 RepID=A0A9J6FTB8_HAELO|nr:hypothetical protein HPB48_017741 [Haemaphysalis longicornis]
MKAEVVKLTVTVLDLEKAVTELTKDYQVVTKELEESRKAVKANEAELSALKATVQAQALELQRIREEQNAAEQYSRNAKLEIHGLPAQPGENLHDVLNDLAGTLELPNLSPDDVTAVHPGPSWLVVQGGRLLSLKIGGFHLLAPLLDVRYGLGVGRGASACRSAAGSLSSLAAPPSWAPSLHCGGGETGQCV